LLLSLNAITVREIQPDAGMFRSGPILVADHVPPKVADVPVLIDEMLDHANGQTDGFYAAAFILWRVCWIHPFSDGNGRVARMLSYVCLSLTLLEVVDLGGFFSQLLEREDEYRAALADADKRWAASDQDYNDPDVVRDLEQLLLDIYADLQQLPND
jgi:Fic family protein